MKPKTTANAKWIADYIVSSQDFPTKGVNFKWYGPLLRNPKAFDRIIKELASRYKGKKSMLFLLSRREDLLAAQL